MTGFGSKLCFFLESNYFASAADFASLCFGRQLKWQCVRRLALGSHGVGHPPACGSTCSLRAALSRPWALCSEHCGLCSGTEVHFQSVFLHGMARRWAVWLRGGGRQHCGRGASAQHQAPRCSAAHLGLKKPGVCAHTGTLQGCRCFCGEARCLPAPL